MTYRKLYIIGNGFDLFHRIPSKYSDFESYVRAHNDILASTIEKYFSFEDFWSGFENSLAHLDINTLLQDADEFLVSHLSEGWRDSHNHAYQEEINGVVEMLSTTLTSEFEKWIRQLTIPNRSRINPSLSIDPDGTFLNFNYTSTLTSLYSVPASNILYIHGEAAKTNARLILGHAWNPETRPQIKSNEEEDFRISQGNQIIESYFSRTFKSTKEIVISNQKFFGALSSISTVYVMGHSLSDVDIQYYNEIAKNIPLTEVDWKVSYYDIDEQPARKQALLNIGIPSNKIEFLKLEQF